VDDAWVNRMANDENMRTARIKKEIISIAELIDLFPQSLLSVPWTLLPAVLMKYCEEVLTEKNKVELIHFPTQKKDDSLPWR